MNWRLAMNYFSHDRFELSYMDEGRGEPVLLIHGFASSYRTNWVTPGWVKTLTEAGYRAIAFDNRGHGNSSKSYEPEDYRAQKMAGDAAALLDHLAIERSHVMGYSMGARIAAFMALDYSAKVADLIFGGLGAGMIDGVGEWDTIASALLAEDKSTIPDERGRMFRNFADQTKSDREALAACIRTSRDLISAEDATHIVQPALVAVGTTDDIAGAPEKLAKLLPHGEAFAIEGRDHMLSVGDRTFKKRAIEFLRAHPL
jgi:pimeloyl-ACP methyl ester carboxylesterase